MMVVAMMEVVIVRVSFRTGRGKSEHSEENQQGEEFIFHATPTAWRVPTTI
jgi:hypothetical protein